jgi:hypothetical protein
LKLNQNFVIGELVPVLKHSASFGVPKIIIIANVCSMKIITIFRGVGYGFTLLYGMQSCQISLKSEGTK